MDRKLFRLAGDQSGVLHEELGRIGPERDRATGELALRIGRSVPGTGGDSGDAEGQKGESCRRRQS